MYKYIIVLTFLLLGLISCDKTSDSIYADSIHQDWVLTGVEDSEGGQLVNEMPGWLDELRLSGKKFKNVDDWLDDYAEGEKYRLGDVDDLAFMGMDDFYMYKNGELTVVMLICGIASLDFKVEHLGANRMVLYCKESGVDGYAGKRYYFETRVAESQ